MSDIRQTAFEIVDRLRSASSILNVYFELDASKNYFGYDAFLITGLPNSHQQNLSDCKIMSGWPAEWERRYQARKFIHIDPVINQIRRTTDPFFWQQALDETGTAAGQVVFEEARAFGLNAGLCIPFHQLDGTEAGVSFGGERFGPSRDESAALHLVALYAMSAAKALGRKQRDRGEKPKHRIPLSPREIECLKWTAGGKTAWEISVILSLSSRTVEKYLHSATQKLGAGNRTQCVAEALRRGIIR
ncbi:LuxR family transcriptional regulator [Methylobacterium sp. J-070]|uniref:LuxR family transcriptional regulator n=1 Tax=Methylobacterium sp. J-070 TaxID=2836650 RepID=UPI001FBB2E07|nr:LuxR family transcriptional regulator [Methylobacterium sp. J-070]MCJ2050282.1 LuxR family transcriptional regulator [Methylobacterium sp. J-070]